MKIYHWIGEKREIDNTGDCFEIRDWLVLKNLNKDITVGIHYISKLLSCLENQ